MALAPQFSISDAQGKEIAYVKQKLFKLKEDIKVFTDSTQTTQIYSIKADRWLDWSASYLFTDMENNNLGKVGRKGTKSLWKATYNIIDNNDQHEFIIQEHNAFVKIMDGLFSEIPVLNFFTGYFFNPKYDIKRTNGEVVGQLVKESSLVSRNFSLNVFGHTDESENQRLTLSAMMIVLLERGRG